MFPRATHYNYEEQQLLERNKYLDKLSQEKHDGTILHTIIRAQRDALEYVSLIIARGVDVNAVDSQGHSALSLFVRIAAGSRHSHYQWKNQLAIVDSLIAAGASLDLEAFNTHPLLGEWRSENPRLVAKLLKYGLDVNAVGRDGHTFLMHAMFGDMNDERLKALEMVLRHPGLALETKNTKGKTYKDIAAQRAARGYKNHDTLYVQPILQKIQQEKQLQELQKQQEQVIPEAAVADVSSGQESTSLSSIESHFLTASPVPRKACSNIMRAIYNGELQVVREHFSLAVDADSQLGDGIIRQRSVRSELETFVFCAGILPSEEAVTDRLLNWNKINEGDRWKIQRWRERDYGHEDDFFYTPLQFAVFAGQYAIALFLIELMRSMEVNFNPFKWTFSTYRVGPISLSTLIPYANIEVIKSLLEASISRSPEITCFGDTYTKVLATVLTYPALAIEIVPYLIAAKVQIKDSCVNGRYILSHLIKTANNQQAYITINHLSCTNNSTSLSYYKHLYVTSLHQTAPYQTPEELSLIKQLVDAGVTFESLRADNLWAYVLCSSKNVALLKTCLDNGLKSTMVDESGNTLLMWLMRKDIDEAHLQMIEMLLSSQEFDLEQVNGKGLTAEGCAIQSKEHSLVKTNEPNNYDKYVVPLLRKMKPENDSLSASASDVTVAAQLQASVSDVNNSTQLQASESMSVIDVTPSPVQIAPANEVISEELAPTIVRIAPQLLQVETLVIPKRAVPSKGCLNMFGVFALLPDCLRCVRDQNDLADGLVENNLSDLSEKSNRPS